MATSANARALVGNTQAESNAGGGSESRDVAEACKNCTCSRITLSTTSSSAFTTYIVKPQAKKAKSNNDDDDHLTYKNMMSFIMKQQRQENQRQEKDYEIR